MVSDEILSRLVPVSDDEIQKRLVSVDAPNNTVFDEANGRVLSLPQTLTADETQFVIDRDVDEVKDFFGQQPINTNESLAGALHRLTIGNAVGAAKAATTGVKEFGKGAAGFAAQLPQAVAASQIENAEVSSQIASGITRTQYAPAEIAPSSMAGLMGTQIGDPVQTISERLAQNETVVANSQMLIERNKKFMADAGFTRPEQGSVAGVMYDLGQGAGSLMTSLGLAALTRSPASAAVFFGALSKSQVYQEAREAGEDPLTASNISTFAGVVEGGVEAIGVDRFMRALRGNSSVKKFIRGAMIEGAQEATQTAANEAITQGFGIRDKEKQQTAQDILYSAFLGSVVGGASSVAIGSMVKGEAEEAGFTQEQADALAKYAEANVEAAKENMGEFIEKELAPIAADEPTAMEFMTLMQKFSNDVSLVEPEQLDPETRQIFDQYIEVFNQSITDQQGVEATEKAFFDMAVNAGRSEDEAAAQAKIWGARADAASRALGITPMQWMEMWNLDIQQQEGLSPMAADTLFQDASAYDRSGEAITESDAFKQWFGDSKVVDADGKPLVVYHGTKANFEEFRPEFDKLKRGFWFGSSEVASRFSLSEREDAEDSESNVIPVYLKIENPFIYDAQDSGRPKSLSDIYEITSPENPNGYDGIMFVGGQSRAFVAFSPTQIKSVFNRGTFDPNDARILFQSDAISTLTGKELGEESARGNIQFSQQQTIINLFREANASTLLHEMGHLFLRDMRMVASTSRRPRVKKDYEVIKQWLGMDGDKFTVEQEEKFARGFERYLMEGKAPKPELQSVFDRFKDWLTAIYRNVRNLNADINPQVREVFDRMLGGDFVLSERMLQQRAMRDTNADYQAIMDAGVVGTFKQDTADVLSDGRNLAANTFVPVSTRLGNIDKRLKHAVRRFTFNTGIRNNADRQAVKPFVESVSKSMTQEDYLAFDYALKNRDVEKQNELLEKYELTETFQPVRDLLDGMFQEALDVGLDINYIEDYFPREVKRGKVDDYLAYARGLEYWSDIENALQEADPNSVFTKEEEAQFINNYLRGFTSNRINLSRPSFSKTRAVDYVTPEANQYYRDSMETLIGYVDKMRYSIEARRLFGKDEKSTDASIGAYVGSMVKEGLINAEQEREVKTLLKAVVEPSFQSNAVTWSKNAGYVYLMGSPVSAITQVGDLAFSLYENGYYQTGKAFFKSLAGRQRLKKEDLGINNILQEFEGNTRAASAVNKVFRLVGLEFMDNVGKETFLESALSRMQKQAKSGDLDFLLTEVFDSQAKQVKKDLMAGNITEDVKYLLYSELSDIQPVSLAEMPLYYLNSGNGRIFYMLKTYTMKQFDIYRREVFTEIASGEPKRVAGGLSNLVRLATALMLMNMTADVLKDLLLGRDIVIDDLVMDNIIRLFGASKYQIYKSKQDGFATTIFHTLFVPPISAPIDDLIRDISDISEGKKDISESRVLGKTPIVGKLYYWWWGGGRSKEEKKTKKKAVSTP